MKATLGALVLMAAGPSFMVGNDLVQAGSSEPAGIGEKGTGQTQSTLERSGGAQSKSSQDMSSEPTGIGEKGTGQTQSTMERSGSGQSNR